ncbi:hypothetical protein PENSPDRAFT_669538 [Peniophora sp. CONT]|nr:hypothetical protein PENSPDRAFT_669538 [Peniophora sp. CONT]
MNSVKEIRNTIAAHIAHASDPESLELWDRFLREQLRYVGMRLNMHAGPNRLPKEIIEETLEYLPPDAKLAVAGTNHHLRNIVLGAWTCLPAAEDHLTTLCLDRTGSRRLTLTVGSTDARAWRDEGARVERVLRAASGRISNMLLTVTGLFVDDPAVWVLEQMGRVALPTLRDLRVHNRTFSATPTIMLKLRDALDRGTFHHLTHLHLVNCGTMPLRDLPTSLEHLVLYDDLAVVPITDLLASLQRLPKLVALDIGLSVSTRHAMELAVDVPTEPTALLSLRKLVIRGPWDLATAIVRASALDNACCIEVASRIRTYGVDPAAARALSALMRHLEHTRPRRIAMVMHESHHSGWGDEDVRIVVDEAQLTIAMARLHTYRPVNDDWPLDDSVPLYARLREFDSVTGIPRLCIEGGLCDVSDPINPPFPTVQELAFHARWHGRSTVPELRVAVRLIPTYPNVHLVKWTGLAFPNGGSTASRVRRPPLTNLLCTDNQQAQSDFVAMVDALIALDRNLELRFVRSGLPPVAQTFLCTRTGRAGTKLSVSYEKRS